MRSVLPAAERHHDRSCEAAVERHRGPMVAEIMEVKVPEAGLPGW